VRILAITGASGGHIFPALGFLDTLKNKQRNLDVLLVLPRKGVAKQIGNIGHRVAFISVAPIKLRCDFRNLASGFRFLQGSWESIFILAEFKPDIVVGFGSLVCVPMILFAWLFRIKTLIHEQNVIPGRANRFLAKFTDKIAVSVAETCDHLKDYKRKIVVTGNPLRGGLMPVDRNKALGLFGLKSNKFTILVMGGSQASHRINFGFLKAVSTIPDKPSLQVIHLAGAKDVDFLRKKYQDMNIDARLFNFLETMQYAYSACDLVISRAGATSIAEIMFFGLPAIIIPYPFAYRHQMANAEVLESIGSGIIIPDKELDGNILRKNIENLINNNDTIKAMRSCYDNIPRQNTNELFTEAVLSELIPPAFLQNARGGD